MYFGFKTHANWNTTMVKNFMIVVIFGDFKKTNFYKVGNTAD